MIVDKIDGREGRWFLENMKQELGDGKKVSFWEGLCTGELSLKESFNRLYQLSSQKDRKWERWESGKEGTELGAEMAEGAKGV